MFRIKLTRSAVKELKSLPQQIRGRIVRKIDGLQENPRPSGSKKLKGTDENLWRIRIGDYSVVYSIEDEIEIVEIFKVGHRKDIYT